ncbi:hypothetical protein PIB30_018813 [Stylosanthes scabra]|uniref:Uncharacterized protein n=1 Tax=Stylosanthes scabra TaxID=79078 RepID=A0ABU6S8P7_9FABA|nr:hypothetical protein [Stylosanthes scabra]
MKPLCPPTTPLPFVCVVRSRCRQSLLQESLPSHLVSPPLPTAIRPAHLLAAATAVSLQLVSPWRSVLTTSHHCLFASRLGGPCLAVVSSSSISDLSVRPSFEG